MDDADAFEWSVHRRARTVLLVGNGVECQHGDDADADRVVDDAMAVGHAADGVVGVVDVGHADSSSFGTG